MAGRCGCASDQCSCVVVAGENVEVTGTGTRSNPYVVAAATTVINEGGAPAPAPARLTGEIISFGGLAAPSGWLVCNGQAVNRAVYSDLYAVVGTRFGAGDGSTTFNLPDFTGRFPMGSNGTNPVGTKAGTNAQTITQSNMPPHTHPIDHDHAAFDTASGGAHTHSYATAQSNTDGTTNSVKRDASTTGSTAIGTSGNHTHNINVPAYAGASGSSGSGTPLDITPAMTAVTFIIKA